MLDVDAAERDTCRRSACCATRVEQQAAADWAELAADDGIADEEDPLFQEDINRLCNVGLKAMLKESSRGVREWQDELNTYGQHFADTDNTDAVTFIFTLYQMSEHKLPTESLKLKGLYLKAFGKLFDVLEDSGWALKRGDESDAEDDEDGSNDDSDGDV